MENRKLNFFVVYFVFLWFVRENVAVIFTNTVYIST